MVWISGRHLQKQPDGLRNLPQQSLHRSSQCLRAKQLIFPETCVRCFSYSSHLTLISGNWELTAYNNPLPFYFSLYPLLSWLDKKKKPKKQNNGVLLLSTTNTSCCCCCWRTFESIWTSRTIPITLRHWRFARSWGSEDMSASFLVCLNDFTLAFWHLMCLTIPAYRSQMNHKTNSWKKCV